ncbi:DUF190 domain-containing protein [Streptomyces sp. PTM05]|uniref:DUF190 domain-containing protein n=1 Tax=Streptantibioticus parmotrematis TaxID=2873249 RepID=A0ABS7R095_9ACTN|nr:DUF190 domain-containing protein [Streptantibioticus parmotrematis]MBY8888376.1 DUF190 domain-containing protein [Streptantibioticus parmotrematis]
MSPHLPHLHHRDDAAASEPRQPREPLSGPVTRLTIHLGDGDQYHHRPLYTEIVHRAHRAGLAGASVLRGIEGFAGGAIHTSRLLDLAEGLPVVVVIVDTDQRVRDFLPELAEVACDRLVTLERAEAVVLTPPESRSNTEEGAL